MKTIGLLGGMSWPSTIEYYRILNQLTQEKLNGFHSANLLLRNIDYHEIKSRYHDRWDEIPLLLKQEIEAFICLAPDCLLICNNTLHKAFDRLEFELHLALPVFHIVDAVGRFAQAHNLKDLLLLGTKFTMEDGFYQRRLEQKFNLTVKIPNLTARIAIQDIQSQLARGILTQEFRSYFRELIGKYSTVDGVILACTELPLAIHQSDVDVVILNSIDCQCQEAFKFATGDRDVTNM
jgi:aspartate racemase